MSDGRNGTARTLPHNLDAEEYLLSSCTLQDTGADTLTLARAAGLTARSFYIREHGIFFDCLCSLQERGEPTETYSVMAALKATGRLEEIGGTSFITQVTKLVPTSAEASRWIEEVRHQALLRDAIKSATALVEAAYNYTGGSVGEHLAPAFARLRSTVEGKQQSAAEMTWNSLMNFDPKADSDCLMGKRYLCRTGGAVIVAPSGVGKSVLSVQLAACAALGAPFFGLQMAFPLRVLYVQAEDDIGDVAEAVQGVVREYAITGAKLDELKRRLRIVRWNDAAGEKFLARLRAEHRAHPFDFAIANPLFSFCGCDVSKQAEMSPFLRNGLNPILNETGAALAFVHHTSKPRDDDKSGKGNEELRSLGSGGVELTNWARAIITLQQVKAAGANVYKMAFAKRGHRAGLVDAEGNSTTSVLIEHSPRGLCWLPSDYAPNKDSAGRFESKIDISRARRVYVPGLTWARNKAAIAKDQGLTPRAVHEYRDDIENGLEAVA